MCILVFSRYFWPESFRINDVAKTLCEEGRQVKVETGRPTQNAYIERFNRTARHEWLDLHLHLHLFESIEQAQLLATKWLWPYNNERPYTAIGGMPPRQLLNAA